MKMSPTVHLAFASSGLGPAVMIYVGQVIFIPSPMSPLEIHCPISQTGKLWQLNDIKLAGLKLELTVISLLFHNHKAIKVNYAF